MNLADDSTSLLEGGQRVDLVPLAALIAADGLSRLGSAMTVTVVPWFVLVTTGSAARTGVTVFASGLGVVIALLFGGTLVDRIGFRRSSVGGDLIAGIVIVTIPTIYFTVGLPFWLLAMLVFLAALFEIPSAVARYSSLPDVAQRAGVRFERANATFDAILTGASLVGPAVAGVLIVVIGASNVLWFDAGTFGLSAILIRTLVPVPSKPAPNASVASGYLRQLSEAARFVIRDYVLGPLVLVLILMNLAIGPLESVVVPVLARDVYHSAYVLGLLSSAMALGGLGGNVLFGIIGHRLSRRAVFGLGFLMVPLALAALAVQPSVGVALAILAVVGLGLSLTNLLEYTIYFERFPQEMRARGLGITGALSWGSAPISRIACGFGFALFGIGATLGAGALVFLPVPLALLMLPRFRRLNSPANDEPNL